MSVKEEARRALSSLWRADPERQCYLPAAAFRAALSSAGLRFGTTAVDQILSLCDVDGGGVVDFSRFAEHVEQQPASPIRQSVRGLEFETTLEGEGGYSAPRDPSFQQDQKVKSLHSPLTQLFHRFDNGKLRIDMFRQCIRDMGLHETADLQRLLRQPHGFQLREMIQALSAPVGFGVADGSAAGKERGVKDAPDIFATSTKPATSR